MKPKERLLTSLDHREPDRVPLTHTSLWLDTRLKLKQHYDVTSDESLYAALGIEPDRALTGVRPPEDWRPFQEYLDFCEAIGYDYRDQYATYEEMGY